MKSFPHPGIVYRFDDFVLEPGESRLSCAGRAVTLTPKAFDTLVALVAQSGHVVTKEELMQKVWGESFVEENNLAQNISHIRRALAESSSDKRNYIETVPRRGYRFTAEVIADDDDEDEIIVHERVRVRQVVIEEDDASAPRAARTLPPVIETSAREILPPAAPLALPAADPFAFHQRAPETHYARSGDVNIAYQVVGDAPLDLVFVMGWVSHLEYFWAEPSFARFLNRLASFARLILFDKRGTGLSDRVPVNELPTLEQRMDDVHAVMEAAGSRRAALVGVSEGGPMCSLFAATYPEMTSALVMIGTYAKRIWSEDYPWAPTVEQREHFFREMQEQWGGAVGIHERAPSMANDEQFRQWWATYLRMGASPGAAVALTRMNAEIDVRAVLPSIRVPTLVIHRTDDACLKVEEGRYVAKLIPHARYVELPGADHLPFVGDQDAMLDEIEEFLTGVRHTVEPDRVLATVLYTRIAHRDERGAARDAEEWAEIIGRLRAHIHKEIEWFRGREMDLEGDRPLAIFDGPARAVRCACAINNYTQRLGIAVRSGLHTGECDIVETGVGGVAARIGAEVAACAPAGEIVVSSTVKDLVAGSGLKFEDFGRRAFNDAGEWQLYRVQSGGYG